MVRGEHQSSLLLRKTLLLREVDVRLPGMVYPMLVFSLWGQAVQRRSVPPDEQGWNYQDHRAA